jgi:broad specificity phosphatase PhoE
MIKHLYIFRHGQTDWNKERRTQGWLDIPLNDTGVEQAQKLADVLKPVNLDIIYSSPLSRALKTAEIVAQSNNAKILTHDDLRERNSGVLGGKIVRITSNPAEEQLDLSQDLIIMPANVMQDPDFAPENGESRNDMISRSFAAIAEIAKTSDNQRIGIATHGGVARSIIAKFADLDLAVGGMPNATYFRLDWDGEKLSLNELPEWLASPSAPKGGE